MKTLIITLIAGYQKFASPLLHQLLGQKNLCRYSISCSEFAKEVIIKHGVLRGSAMALNRFLHCQPFGKSYAHI